MLDCKLSFVFCKQSKEDSHIVILAAKHIMRPWTEQRFFLYVGPSIRGPVRSRRGALYVGMQRMSHSSFKILLSNPVLR